MSNLSQFFGGGGPSNIIRGSTSIESAIIQTPERPNSTPQRFQDRTASATISTGVFVDADNTYITQGCRGNVEAGIDNNSQGSVAYTVNGSASARINSSGEVLVTSGDGYEFITQTPQSPESFYSVVINSSTVDWEAVEY